LGASSYTGQAGVMNSAGNIAINVEADRYEAGSSTRIMNRCHGMWSIVSKQPEPSTELQGL
jgi:hypothetical protein